MSSYRGQARGSSDRIAAAARLINTVLLALAGIWNGLTWMSLIWADRYRSRFALSAMLVLGAGIYCRSRSLVRPLVSTGIHVLVIGSFLWMWSWYSSHGPERDELEVEGNAIVASIESGERRNE